MPHNAPSFTIDPDEAPPPPRKPRTLHVLLMLVIAAAAFSYLWAYALPDVLIANDLLPRWPDGTDPRPRRLGIAFAGVMGAFLALGMMARIVSSRQMRSIDAMGDE
ncbi:hypothetical protein [Humisphaera borealis]|uniref:Uncharacterized protein n=1 Tax=Humisphaera borealis TaxID=2807512 RepID=A0A7M2WPK6_9BACT|nr:hypothetical protein [Humisphaera borealis]QOV87396.1 hypothetical protein IPV69_13960 [Humisphaera borealis]